MPEYDRYSLHPCDVSFALSPRRMDLVWEKACALVAYSGRYAELGFIGGLPLTVASYLHTGPLISYIPTTDIDILAHLYRTDFCVPPDFAGPHMTSKTLRFADMLLCSFDPSLSHLPETRTSVVNPTRWTVTINQEKYKLNFCLSSTLGLAENEQWTAHTPTFLPMLEVAYHPNCQAQTNLLWAQGGQTDLENQIVRLKDPVAFLNIPDPDAVKRLIYLCKHACVLPNAKFDPNSLKACQDKMVDVLATHPEYSSQIDNWIISVLDSVINLEANNSKSVEHFISYLNLLGIPNCPKFIHGHAKNVRPQVENLRAKLTHELEANRKSLSAGRDSYLGCLPEYIARPI